MAADTFSKPREDDLVPVFDYPVIVAIVRSAVAHCQDSMVQTAGAAFLIVIHPTGVELELVA